MMARKRQIPFQLFKLAEDLGLKAGDDPVASIVAYCDDQVGALIDEMEDCRSLTDLLEWVAAKVGTIFEQVGDEDELQRIKGKYLQKGEKAFANLENELSDEVFGVTYRRQNKLTWEPLFVSVIDSRGEKAPRTYFTKWHELAHLLTLTEQRRLVFRRTHAGYGEQDPEEKLMDIIAGRFGFYGPVFHRFIKAEISFDEIERLRRELCPDASVQASLISFTKYWPTPCVHIRAELGFNKTQKQRLQQNHFDFIDAPESVLRAAAVSVNEAGRDARFRLFENMRVPTSSVVQQIFSERLNYGEAIEDLAHWTDGESVPVKVKARFRDNGVEGLITPV